MPGMVGGFPGLALSNRRTVRAPVNEMDKSTIFSIFPKQFTETKVTIQPGTFTIEAGSFEKPAILIVGSSSWWREIDEDQPLLELTNSSIQVADSIVKDYCNGLLGCDMVTKMPGLFYLPGIWNVEKLRKEQLPILMAAKEKQKNFWLELVKIADIMWARTNGNPLAVSDDARLACRELHIEDKDWLKNTQAAELVRCVACGALRNPRFPICGTCKAIADPELAKKLNLTFAQ